MIMIFTDLHLALSKRLGWDEMPAKVALPALDRIIEVSGVQDIQVLEKFYSMEFFTYLGFPFEYLSDIKDFQSLRWEIEREMFNGIPYEDAINEWFK